MSSTGGGAIVGVLEQVVHHHLIQAQQGLLPPDIQAGTFKDVLDLNCRTGAWAIDLSLSYPGTHVTGLDSSPQLLEIARQHANVSNLDCTSFTEHHSGQKFPFDDESFDLVHFSMFLPIIYPRDWPTVLRDCWRVIKPGGSINLANLALGPGSSSAYQQVMQLLTRFFSLQGYAFAEQAGALSHGVYLCPLLREVGFEEVTYRLYPVKLGGWNNASGRACCQLFLREVQQNRQVFLDQGLIEGAEFDAIVAQKQQDLRDPVFYASGVLLVISASKAEETA